MRILAERRRFEEAADTRDRASSLARVLARQRRLDALVLAGRLEVEIDGEGGAVIDAGRLVVTWGPAGGATEMPLSFEGPAVLPLAKDAVDEVACVAAWLDAKAHKLRLVHVEHGWRWPAARLARYEAAKPSVAAPMRRPAGPATAVA